MATEHDKPNAGEKVILTAIPPGLLDGLPDEDQRAVRAIVGKRCFSSDTTRMAERNSMSTIHSIIEADLQQCSWCPAQYRTGRAGSPAAHTENVAA